MSQTNTPKNSALTKGLQTAFEAISGTVSALSGEPYTAGKEAANYITTAVTAKMGNKK